MLRGLEISIIKLSALSTLSENMLRLDSEHYSRKYIELNNLLMSKPHQQLKELIAAPVMTGHTPSMKIDSYYGGDIKFIKTDNLREGKISGSFTDYLTVDGAEQLKSSALHINDVITTIIGATHEIVGRAALIKADDLPANINQNIALIRADSKKINPAYLCVYLNTKYGRGSLHMQSRQTEQVNLNCREVERVIVPLFPKISLFIQAAVERADTALKQSQSTYNTAENILLDELGMSNFQPTTKNVSVKSCAESFGQTGRLDAEYYQPKYQDYHALLKRYEGGHAALSKLCHPKDLNYNPKSANTYRYIELSDIDSSGSITGCIEAVGSDLPSRARRKVSVGDVLVSSVEGSLSSCAFVANEYDQALCSTGFYVVSSDEINPETLLVLFKSPLLQNLLKQRCSGTILTAISSSEFYDLPLPIIDGSVQKQISANLRECFDLKAESKRLLDVAKRAVEIAIEQDEAAALDYLTAQGVPA